MIKTLLSKRYAYCIGCTVAAAGLLVVSQPQEARGDTVTLNNGREIHGRLIEERKEEIRIRTGEGVITIPKFKIATYSENENWGNYGKPRSVAELAKLEAEKKAAADAARKDPKGKDTKGTPKGRTPKGKTPTKKGGAATVPAEKGEWVWGEKVSEAQIEALTPIRDKLLKELEEIGPTKDERLAKIKLSGEEEADLKQQVRLMGWRRSRGGRGGQAGSAIRRQNAKKELLTRYAERAIPSLVSSLGSASLWQSRTAAEAILELAKKGKDVTWLMWHFKAPAGLLRLMDNEGNPTSAFVRRDGAKALEALGAKISWPDDAKDELRSRAETVAYRKAQDWVKKADAEFTAKQKANAERREKINEDLEKIRNGEDPSAKDGASDE